MKCGYSHTLLLLQDGNSDSELFSFGCNDAGQLGLGRDFEGGYMIRSVNLPHVKKIKASNLSLAVTKYSELFVWGVQNH